MQAPPDACKALYSVFKDLRLAWVGFDDETNPGTFVLIQLMPQRYVGTPLNPKILDDFWSADSDGNRLNRGTIYDRNGGIGRDWADNMEPIIVATMNSAFQYEDGTNLTQKCLHTGRFIEAVKYWLTPRVERIKKSKALKDRENADLLEAASYELANKTRWQLAQTGAPRVVMARKHLKEAGFYDKVDHGQGKVRE